MGIISIEKLDHLYWLGRYTERVYTTLRKFFRVFDDMIEAPEGSYTYYCERLNIPDIYTSNQQFAESYLYGKDNPDSLYSNMNRAFDNAIVLRDELSSNVLSYMQMALDVFEKEQREMAPLLEIQSVLDDLLAFWGCVDDYVEDEECRNIMKCGKYVERLDLYIRLEYHTKDIEKEFSKLTNRLHKTPMYYDAATLEKIAGMIHDKLSCPEKMAGRDQELLDCLGNIIEVR